MKTILILIAFTITSIPKTYAQKESTESPKIDTIDINDLNIFLYPRIDFPREIFLNNESNSVTFSFKILKNGGIDSIKILKSNSDEIRDEVIRILNESSGKWTPALKNGEPVVSTVKYEIGAGLSWTKAKAINYLSKAKKNESKSKYKKAIKYYSKLLILIPNNSETICDIARNYFLLGDKSNGCKVLDDCTFKNCSELKSIECN